jgi:hypothetical protein
VVSEPKPNNAADAAIDGQAARALGVTGAGIKVGIISDSFNNLAQGPNSANNDTYQDDIQNGYLPGGIVYTDAAPSSTGQYTGTDEGRAMAQLVYETAPGAQIEFVAAGAGKAGPVADEDMAAAVNKLAQAGCTIIVDDIDPLDSPAFQVGSALDNAVESFIQKGGDYFSAAGNDGSQYYQGPPQQQTVTVPDVGTVSNASLVQVEPNQNGILNLNFYWSEPFGSIGDSPGAQSSFKLYLYDYTAQVLVPSDKATIASGADEPPRDPYVIVQASELDPSHQYVLVASVTGPVPSAIRLVASNGAGSLVLAPGTSSGSAGDLFGHELVPGINNVGAASVAAIQTAQSTSPPGPLQNEAYSQYGPGEILFSPDGTRLSTPQPGPGVTFTAPVGSITSVVGKTGDGKDADFAPFPGTSAAAPVAAAVSALVLQAAPNLSTTQVSQILQETAIPMVNPAQAGAGLIQAQQAVELAKAYASITSATDSSDNSASMPSVVTIAAETTTVIQSVSNAVVTAPSGDHMFFIYGDYDALVAPSGTQTGALAINDSTIITGSGNDQILISGSRNTIDAGDGSNLVIDSGGDNTIILPALGDGFDTIYGDVLQNGTVFDFRPLLAHTEWDGSQSTIGDFVKLANQNGSTQIQVDAAGTSSGSSTAVAILVGQIAPSLDSLLLHTMA